MAIFASYCNTRARIGALLSQADEADLARVVPACPDWKVRDLLTHLVSTPAALSRGRFPKGDLNDWLAALLAERPAEPIGALLAEWESLDPALEKMLQGPAAVLFADVSIHEHDLRAALGKPDHAALEADALPFVMATLDGLLRAADLAPVEVSHDGHTWSGHDGAPGWTLLVDPWEAVRALGSRRTADELRRLPSRGDCEPYLPVLDAHFSLPDQSLSET